MALLSNTLMPSSSIAGTLAFGLIGEIFRLELVALAGVDGDRLVGKAGFLEEERDLGRVGRSVEVEFEHSEFSPTLVADDKVGARRHCRREQGSMLKFWRGAQATSL